MKKTILVFNCLMILAAGGIQGSEKRLQEPLVAIDFEQLDDNVVVTILSHLPISDLLKMRSTEKRMLPLVEMVLAERRVEMLSGNDLFNIRRFAKSKYLKDTIEAELLKRGKKQNEEFKKLVEGETLNLSKRNIHCIYPGAFNGLVNLHSLWLDNNQLKQLDPGIFKGLVSLRWLWLSGNQLKQLDPGIFKGLVNLRCLWLYDNQLKQLDPGVFDGLDNLQKLDLDNNQLKQLDQGAFKGLVNLQELSLSGNQLSSENRGLLRAALKGVNITFE